MLRPIALATALCGTLDILLAIFLTLSRGKEIGAMLRYVASGPFPAASGMETGGALLGLVVHYALMAIMVAVFVFLASQWPILLRRPLLSGLGYGLLTYIVMNLVVVPLRFHPPFPPSGLAISTQLFAHLILVGIPTALIAARFLPATRPLA
ncbi:MULTISPECIES: hypothetical protein [Sphingomonas]|uniref:hypothetical protein n=1 Tax=Sphingomonas TaxID=13687 RepID=UPI000DEFC582|nr:MULTISPECIES: hypothetical protein [Sphingomonas]